MMPRTGQKKIAGLYTSFSVKLAIANTDMTLLEAIRANFGGKIEQCTTSKHVDCTNYKVGYRIRWFGKPATDIIETCRPYLIVKAKQADLAMMVVPMQQQNKKRHENTLDKVLLFNQIAAEIKRLNKRGVK